MRKTKFKNEKSQLDNKFKNFCNNEITRKQMHAIKGRDGDGSEFILTEELIDF